MKKRILFGLEASSGGALKHLTYLVKNLNKERFSITIILSNSRSDYDEGLVAQLENTTARILNIPMSRNIRLLSDFIVFRTLHRHIKAINYDIVHAHSSKAGALFRLAAWFNNIQLIVYTPHCFYFQSKRGFKRFIFTLTEKLLSRFCHAIIVSNHERNVALAHKIAHRSKLININNAINFDEYTQYKDIQNIKKQWEIPNSHFVVGAVGRLVPQKDWLTLIKAAIAITNSRDDVCFIIAGSGHMKDQIQKEIELYNLQSKVKLLGHIPDISKVYSIIDLFVSTSLWEGLPYAYLEAGYFKKPVIATGTYDHTPFNEELGFNIVPIKKHNQLANSILKLINNKQKAKSLGENSYMHITEKYSFSRFIKKHELLYQKG